MAYALCLPISPIMSRLRHALSRFGLYGDRWMRYLHFGALHTPAFLEPLAIGGFTFVFFLAATKQRRAIVENLCVILPGTTRLGNFFRAIRVFWNFAWGIADSARATMGQDAITWEIEGQEHFEELRKWKGGALVLTAHMGSYDLAAPFFAERFGRPFNAVRVPEKYEAMQKFMETKRDAQCSEAYKIRYNRPGSLLGIELVQALARGEVAAIQGDRVLADVTPADVPFGQHYWQLPKGPMVLSMAAKVPMFPIFVARTGWRRYRVIVKEPFFCQAVEGSTKDECVTESLQTWAGVLSSVLRDHWGQWFVLERAFSDAATSNTKGEGS